MNKVVCENINRFVQFFFSAAFCNFKTRAKTELYLAHYRVPRGLSLVTYCDVVSGTCIRCILCFSIDFLLNECELSEVSILTLEIMPARCVAASCGNVKENIDCGSRNLRSSHLPARPRPPFARYWTNLKAQRNRPSRYSTTQPYENTCKHYCHLNFRASNKYDVILEHPSVTNPVESLSPPDFREEVTGSAYFRPGFSYRFIR